LLAAHEVQATVEEQIQWYHDQARSALLVATAGIDSPARDRLLALIEHLATRTG
jgi:hypothetical protein